MIVESTPTTRGTVSGRRIDIRGTVQGVGFRPWVYRLAHRRGLAGRVSNNAAGVTIEAFGPESFLDAFCDDLRASPPPAVSIRHFAWQPIATDRETPIPSGDDFVIVASRRAGERRLSIPPDLATCEACRREVFDPTDRRHRYPFTNCTHCGPRFSLALDVPYDRPATTMKDFELCPQCRREYEDPIDRRFHAQPNACPVCGPRLRLLNVKGTELPTGDPIHDAARALEADLTVAVKGIGGFHLAVNATSQTAVERLRDRKRREEKPFAVMVRDLAAARRVAVLNAEEERLLTSVESPIVLVRQRDDSGLAKAVAPDQAGETLPLVGLLLPYSPLHHLLMAETEVPLVMTSGNLSEEPMACSNAEALHQLGDIADLFLVHDREIASLCDDSVARVIAGAPVVLRRARGYVPRPIAVSPPFEEPVLACGAHLKNTFCIGFGDTAYLGPHIGDLESLAAYTAYADAIEHMERLLQVEPRLVAHDLHPEYLSTRYALERAGRKVAVQHHHAHVVSAMAEHGLAGPVLGIAFDGVGHGSDGEAWGGEILYVEDNGFERLAALRPIHLAGGDVAVRQVWRLALAVLDDAFEDEPPLEHLALFRQVESEPLRVVQEMIAKKIHSPPAHGAGRYFDAAGALLLARAESSYEGQVALALNTAADCRATTPYPWSLHSTPSPWEIDLRPAFRALVAELLLGTAPAVLAGRFHGTLADAAAGTVHALAEQHGPLPVVLTGGCFQNPLLTETLLATLADDFEVVYHREVPPGDGGIALGQAVVAARFAGRSDAIDRKS